MQSFVFGATSAWQHHFWLQPAPEQASVAQSSIAATGTSLFHMSAGQRKLKGLLASSFLGLQFLRPPHTASVLGASEISPDSSLDTEEINFVSCTFIVFYRSTSRHKRTDALIPVCITTDLNV